MILYDFRCPEGHRFEALVSNMQADSPDCEVCGMRTERKPTAPRLRGLADVGIAREQMPNTWRAVRDGDRETVRHWHTVARRREALEERHPELAGDRRPVLAHEGIFEGRPLRAGDDITKSVDTARAARLRQGTKGTGQ
ncbi:FmdB family zinc ribbon protein [Tsukamurella tyrosinosolvens]|uniref:FmdB family zinc ribbon protein n=1 Tax=Tsukamurella tyrosinosolvens TaxID=57704 RepID=UPI00187F0750|nr:zinc ribbon domain-containing protein [Tsukamurella tyrosinosolvens]